MIRIGLIAIILSVVCVALTVLGMVGAFGTLAASQSTGVSPAAVAQGIDIALLPLTIAIPLALAGIILLLLGFRRRRMHQEPGS